MTTNKETTISFVTPCYNDGTTIEKLINSLRDQDLPGIEIIVVNDGSTDNSMKVLEAMKQEGKIDKLIDLESNKGACIARNVGAKEATGKYLSFLPADAFLYPGMARIWYETLEDHPDYEFLYGGYRFVDEEGEPLPNNDYLSQPFDPYLLDVANYIDGSFPIRRDAFWKYAEKMGQPDGLWDPNVKSLQDWDFWLSVVKNGGKGIYVQDVFFGTTLPHPGGLSYDSSQNWLDRTEFIKKKQGIPLRKLCVASLGAAWHAKRVAWMLDADFKDMPSFKPHRYDAIYTIGFYPEFAPQQDQMFLKNVFNPSEGRVASKKIVHFVGSDIWQLYHCSMMSLGVYKKYFANTQDPIKVLCEAEFTKKELSDLGIDAEVVPIPPAKLYGIQPLPKDFTVACYQPLTNGEFYRPKEMIEIARKLPDVKFKFFGNPKKVGYDPELPQNIEYCGYIDNMESFLGECSAIMRFPIHDGLPLSVLEFILAGRYSVQSVPIDHSYYLPEFNIDQAVEAIKDLRKMAEEKGVNQEGSDYWRKELDHDKYKQKIYSLFEYKPKEYWENRARDWADTSKDHVLELDDVKKLFDQVDHKSVLDIGCGDGRWYPHLQSWGMEKYKGIDISENLVKAAQFRFPHEKDNFETVKVEELPEPKEKADLVFSYTCLEHVKDEDFPKAVEAIKKQGKKLLLIEATNFISRNYCFNHDYEKHFKVIDKVILPSPDKRQYSEKIALLCDLESQ